MTTLSRKVFKSHEIIYSVMEFMKKGPDHGRFLIDCKKVTERALRAVGVSWMTNENKREFDNVSIFHSYFKLIFQYVVLEFLV